MFAMSSCDYRAAPSRYFLSTEEISWASLVKWEILHVAILRSVYDIRPVYFF